MDSEIEHDCSFCGVPTAAANLVAGGGKLPSRMLPLVYICDACIRLCAEILRTQRLHNGLVEQWHDWTPLEVDGQQFEWTGGPTELDGAAAVHVVVRKLGEETGPAVVRRATMPSRDLALELARDWSRWSAK